MPKHSRALLSALFIVLGLSTVAYADEPEIEPPPPRELPDYDGREEPTTAGDVLIWVPRVILAPVYLVTEYVLRRPVVWLVGTIEREEVIPTVVDFFSYERGYVMPVAFYDYGFRPSAGIRFRYNDWAPSPSSIRIQVATAGIETWDVGAVAHVAWDLKRFELEVRTDASARPDGLYLGIGPEMGDVESRYSFRRVGGETTFTRHLTRLLTTRAHVGVTSMTFGEDINGDDTLTVPELATQQGEPEPPGYGGYTALRTGVSLALDTRRPRPLPGGGTRIELGVTHHVDLGAPTNTRWVSASASVGGYLDLSMHNHVVGLIARAALAEPTEGHVPFTELVTAGDNGPLRGFVGPKLLGHSMSGLVLEYRWPILSFLDGELHAAMGSVTGRRFEGWSLDKQRLSFGGGLLTSNSREESFGVSFAVGTEELEDGAAIDSTRFTLGASRAF